MKLIKYLLLITLFFGLFGGIYYITNQTEKPMDLKPTANNEDPEEVSTQKKHDSPLAQSNQLNILLLGIDRRSKSEDGYRTDIMIATTIDKETNRVVMASLPRDLWWNGGRLNAVFVQSGWDELRTAVGTITGFEPTNYIISDFEDFRWIVDSMGGVPVNVQTTFTDTQYPIDETFEYQTVTFTQGEEKLSGERALIFSRSRKGDNDSGDWGRMKRQHLILNGMVDAAFQPGSIFKDMEVKTAFTAVTNNKMMTNLTLSDATYLWDMYKDKDKYSTTSLYLDYDYLLPGVCACYAFPGIV